MCRNLVCENRYVLPMDFKNGDLIVDLGRKVSLGSVDIQIKPDPTTVQNLNLNLKIATSEKQIDLKICSYRFSENYSFGFNCSDQTGRYLLITATGIDSASINGSLQLEDITFYKEVNGEDWLRGSETLVSNLHHLSGPKISP